MEEPQPSVDVPQVTFKKRNVKTKSTLRKRAATPPQDSDSDSGFTSSEDEEGRQIKRRRKNAGLTTSSSQNPKPHPNQDGPTSSAAVVASSNRDDATKTADWFDEGNEKKVDKASVKSHETVAPDGTYKGSANYSSFIQKNPARLGKQVGPVKTSSNVRTITVTDYAPDVCKDYKQTGFCGFGDNCKYLHVREAYKQGWQLDRDWEIDTKGKKLSGKTVASANRDGQSAQDDEDDEALLESIPFACIICKKSYTNPIITKCGHYFCESCALKRYRKDPSCAACGSGTGGVFNVAKKLNRLLDKKKERERVKAERALEAGQDVPDGGGKG